MSAAITVPDLVSLSFAQAYSIGMGAGLVIQGVGPDGQPVGSESERVVVDQDPMAGETMKQGEVLTLRVGRPPDKDGDRVPIDPGPYGTEGQPDLQPVNVPDSGPEGPSGTVEDPDLVPA